MKLLNGWLGFTFLLFSFYSYGQNLCPNPGFEQLSGCPVDAGDINLASPWTDTGSPAPVFSFCHVNGTPPGCNDVGVPLNFAGNASAHGGSAYAGFYTRRDTANRRTYVQAPLTTPLLPGKLYKVQAFFRRSGYSGYATNRIGFVFSTAALSQTAHQFINVTPQGELTSVIADTANWIPFNSYYNAVGGEAFITFGNFRSDAQTTSFQFLNPAPSCNRMTASAFFYIDDVSVIPVNEVLNVTGDSLICTGEQTSLTGITNTTGWWSSTAAPADTIPSVNNSITISPAVTTAYIWHGMQSTYSVTVTVLPPPVISLPADEIICEGESFLIDATAPGLTYLWSTGDTTPLLSVSDSGMYVLTVSNGACNERDTFELSLIPAPPVILPQSITICADNNEFVTLDAGIGNSYTWSPGGDTNRVFIPKTEGIYSVTVTHASGCTRSGSTIVSELCPASLYTPGAFTPNGDGKNDLFYSGGSNILKYRIMIFNRWGQLLFESGSLGITGAWNGEFNDIEVEEGVYVYYISFESVTPAGKRKTETRSGFITLVR